MDVVAVVIVVGAPPSTRQQRRMCPSITARWDPTIVPDPVSRICSMRASLSSSWGWKRGHNTTHDDDDDNLRCCPRIDGDQAPP